MEDQKSNLDHIIENKNPDNLKSFAEEEEKVNEFGQ